MYPRPNPTRSQDSAGKRSVASPPLAQASAVSQGQVPVSSQNALPTPSAMPARTQASQPKTVPCPDIAPGFLSRRGQASPSERLTPYVPGRVTGTSRRISTVKRVGTRSVDTSLPLQEKRARTNPGPQNYAGPVSSSNPFRSASTPEAPDVQVPERSARKIFPRPLAPPAFNPNPFVAHVPVKNLRPPHKAAVLGPATTLTARQHVTKKAVPLTVTASIPPTGKTTSLAPVNSPAPVSAVSVTSVTRYAEKPSIGCTNVSLLPSSGKVSANVSTKKPPAKPTASPVATAVVLSTSADKEATPIANLRGMSAGEISRKGAVLPSPTDAPPVAESKQLLNNPPRTSTVKARVSSSATVMALSAGANNTLSTSKTTLPVPGTRGLPSSDTIRSSKNLKHTEKFIPSSMPASEALLLKKTAAAALIPKSPVVQYGEHSPWRTKTPTDCITAVPSTSERPIFSSGGIIVPSTAGQSALLKTVVSAEPELTTPKPPSTINAPIRQQKVDTVTESSRGKTTSSLPKPKPVLASATLEDPSMEVASLPSRNRVVRETPDRVKATELSASCPESSDPPISAPQAIEAPETSPGQHTSLIVRTEPTPNFGRAAAIWRFLWALVRPRTVTAPEQLAEREGAPAQGVWTSSEENPHGRNAEGSDTDINNAREEVNPHRTKVQRGDWVVLVSSDGKRVLGRVTDGGTARIGRAKRDISVLQGATWGTLFACERNKLRSCPELALDAPIAAEAGAEAGVDNRELRDCGDNQRLSEREIARLKKAGVSGAALIDKVVANSSTFSGKTQYSQEKYLKRKRQKFDIRVRVERPTAFTLCETYFQRSPEKTLHMRWDSLAHLIAYSGVVPNRHVLVAENCIGLVTGTITERLRGRGRVVNMFGGSTPPGIELIRMLNLSEASTDALVHAPIGILDELDIVENCDDEHIRYSVREEGEIEMAVHPTSAKRAEAINRRPKRGLVKQWFKDGFDCLVIAVRHDTVELFDKLVDYLAPSGTFAVYCAYYQEAAELQRALQLSKLVIRVELTEGNLIHHQMLPGRSHPMMSDSATGGYIVSGIRIDLPPISVIGRSSEEDM